MGLITLSELSGLGQTECGPAPGIGPGEKKMCCPDVGWVIYDQHESEYALCERAMAKKAGRGGEVATIPAGPPPSGIHEYEARLAAERRAAELELEAQRRAIEDRRLALEERQFQSQLRTAMLQAQLKQAKVKQAASPEAVAARMAEAEARRAEAMARARALEAAEKAKQRKQLTYAALAAVAAKLLFF
jgi:hypothetical protein